MEPIPLNLTPGQADNALPVGTVLPFKPGEVPENWEEFNGQLLNRAEHTDLYWHLRQASDLWQRLGGQVNRDAITLPGPLTYKEANEKTWGFTFDEPIPMVLAIKVRRDVRD